MDSENSLNYVLGLEYFPFVCYSPMEKLPKSTEDWHTIWPGKSGPWNILQRNSGTCARGETCKKAHRSTGYNSPKLENPLEQTPCSGVTQYSATQQGKAMKPWMHLKNLRGKAKSKLQRKTNNRIWFATSVKICKTLYVI